jgi:hypothetical protein
MRVLPLLFLYYRYRMLLMYTPNATETPTYPALAWHTDTQIHTAPPQPTEIQVYTAPPQHTDVKHTTDAQMYRDAQMWPRLTNANPRTRMQRYGACPYIKFGFLLSPSKKHPIQAMFVSGAFLFSHNQADNC